MNLSIVIVNFNTYSYLIRSLESIYNSELRPDSFEIIIVDNGSSDHSLFPIKKKYPRVNLIVNKDNVGFAKANNQIIKKAHGEFILFLNPDTIILKGTISTVLDFIKCHKEVGVATCKVILPTGQIDDACHRGFPTPWNALCHFTGLSSVFPKSDFFNGYHLGYKDMDKVHEIDSCTGAFMLVRKIAGDQISWFDEDYFWYGEDLDFCYCIKEAGWKICYIPKVQIVHYKGVASGIKKHSQKISSANRKIKLLATKARFDVMEIFYKKHYQKTYSTWLTTAVLFGIKIKKYFALRRYK
jgi:hypothetical protein